MPDIPHTTCATTTSMTRVLLLLCLLTLTACGSLHTLTASTTPHPGWTAAQVEQALGPSVQIDAGMDPDLQLWHYGVGTATGTGFGALLVYPRCDRYSSSCLTVMLHHGLVQDVRVRTY